MNKTLFTVLILAGLFLAGCNLKEEYTRTIEMPLPISDVQKLIVHTDVGSIIVDESNAPQPKFKAEVTGKGDTIEKAQRVAEAINIEIENKDNGDVCLVIKKPVEIKSNWYAVNYTIQVPANVKLECKTDVGNISIKNIKGDIVASCDVGNINCANVSGKLDLRTDVGNINTDYTPTAGITDATLSADVGSIHFKGPENMSAKIDASTDVGKINSAQPGVKKKDCCQESFTGTTGRGEGNIKLRTDVGSINIK
jgi:hypothetical protein